MRYRASGWLLRQNKARSVETGIRLPCAPHCPITGRSTSASCRQPAPWRLPQEPQPHPQRHPRPLHRASPRPDPASSPRRRHWCRARSFKCHRIGRRCVTCLLEGRDVVVRQSDLAAQGGQCVAEANANTAPIADAPVSSPRLRDRLSKPEMTPRRSWPMPDITAVLLAVWNSA